MANPNLANITDLTVHTVLLELTTSETDVVSAVPTNHAYEVNSIFVTNIHATVVALVTVVLKRSGTDHLLCNQMRVGVKQAPTNVLAAGRTIFLNEGDSIRAYAQAVSNAVVYVPYTDFTDATGSP
jgi:hypothetical protein